MNPMFPARTVAPDFRLVETLPLGTGPLDPEVSSGASRSGNGAGEERPGRWPAPAGAAAQHPLSPERGEATPVALHAIGPGGVAQNEQLVLSVTTRIWKSASSKGEPPNRNFS